MFDIGFWELALIAVIGLIVLGPERLPGAARNLGLWAGRARMYVRNLRTELEREVNTSELRQDVESARDEMVRSGRELRAEVAGDDETTSQRDSTDDQPAGGRRVAAETAGTPSGADDGERRE